MQERAKRRKGRSKSKTRLIHGKKKVCKLILQLLVNSDWLRLVHLKPQINLIKKLKNWKRKLKNFKSKVIKILLKKKIVFSRILQKRQKPILNGKRRKRQLLRGTSTAMMESMMAMKKKNKRRQKVVMGATSHQSQKQKMLILSQPEGVQHIMIGKMNQHYDEAQLQILILVII